MVARECRALRRIVLIGSILGMRPLPVPKAGLIMLASRLVRAALDAAVRCFLSTGTGKITGAVLTIDDEQSHRTDMPKRTDPCRIVDSKQGFIRVF